MLEQGTDVEDFVHGASLVVVERACVATSAACDQASIYRAGAHLHVSFANPTIRYAFAPSGVTHSMRPRLFSLIVVAAPDCR